MKTKYLNYVHTFNRCKSVENRRLMLEFKQAYTRLIKAKRLKHQRHIIKTIQRLGHSHPRELWKFFNNKSSNKLTGTFFNSAVGLKQGEIMSPMLFSLFIEDFELFIQDIPNQWFDN